jgi:penicillin-binding protein 2
MVGQAAYLQIFRSEYYKNLSARNSTRELPIFASRGIIYDRNLGQLVYNIPSFDLVVTPQDLPRDQFLRQDGIVKASEISGVSEEEINKQIKEFDPKTAQSFSVASNLTHEKLLILESEIEKMPGWRLEENITRQYVDAPFFSHIIGYLSKIQPADLEKKSDYFLTEKIGRNGLELIYEDILRGTTGKQIFSVDSLGRVRGQVAEVQPETGQGLVLAIDGNLQKKLQESLESILKKNNLKKGAAVALDPKTGGVLAMVSLPSFDNNLFAQELNQAVYKKLANDLSQPLFNRAISGQYPPGSTVKPLISSAALQEKIISPTTKIFDSGELILYNQYNPQIVYRFGDWKAHGIVDMYSAIAQSCDVYFYTIGGGYGNIEGLGIKRLAKYFKEFGFGKILGIDLPGEETGLVPDENWKKEAKSEDWYIGDTYHVSIGQGDLLATPLQLAAATAAIVNGGRLISPHLVDRIVDSDKNTVKTIEPIILNQGFIDEANLTVVKKGMRLAVTDGSARLLSDLKISVGAKTGTAQVTGDKNPNAWATAFAPYDDPQIVIAVLAENAGEGSQMAIPAIRDALEEYFK